MPDGEGDEEETEEDEEMDEEDMEDVPSDLDEVRPTYLTNPIRPFLIAKDITGLCHVRGRGRRPARRLPNNRRRTGRRSGRTDKSEHSSER